MKKLYKYASGLFLTGLLSVAVITTASAQHGGGGGGGFHGGGGGGGFHGGGGVSTHSGSIGALRTNGIGGRSAVMAHGHSTYARGGFYRPGYGYYGYPHFGFYLGFLPFGYYPFYWGDDLYYYANGIFYSPYDGGGYQVTVPPVGAAVPNLPESARSIMIDNQQFYELDGVYYKAVVNDQGKKVYVVAGRDGVLNTDGSQAVAPEQSSAPQVGDIVNELPDGCRKVILNGKKYYVSPNDIYYQAYTDGNGNQGYRIASIPDNDDDNN
jgi:hypothetical protein